MTSPTHRQRAGRCAEEAPGRGAPAASPRRGSAVAASAPAGDAARAASAAARRVRPSPSLGAASWPASCAARAAPACAQPWARTSAASAARGGGESVAALGVGGELIPARAGGREQHDAGPRGRRRTPSPTASSIEPASCTGTSPSKTRVQRGAASPIATTARRGSPRSPAAARGPALRAAAGDQHRVVAPLRSPRTPRGRSSPWSCRGTARRRPRRRPRPGAAAGSNAASPSRTASRRDPVRRARPRPRPRRPASPARSPSTESELDRAVRIRGRDASPSTMPASPPAGDRRSLDHTPRARRRRRDRGGRRIVAVADVDVVVAPGSRRSTPSRRGRPRTTRAGRGGRAPGSAGPTPDGWNGSCTASWNDGHLDHERVVVLADRGR